MKILVSLTNSKIWLRRRREEKMGDLCGYTYYNAFTYFGFKPYKMFRFKWLSNKFISASWKSLFKLWLTSTSHVHLEPLQWLTGIKMNPDYPGRYVIGVKVIRYIREIASSETLPFKQ